MRILFVGLVVPFPPTNGHRLRNSAILQALKEEGHKVTLVTLAEPDEKVGEELDEICHSTELIPHQTGLGIKEYVGRILALASPLPYGVWRFRSPALTAVVHSYLTQDTFDVIICDDIYNVTNLPRDLTIPVLLNKADITYVKHQRYLAKETNPLRLAYGWIEYKKVRRWELMNCSKFSCVLVCSERERKILEPLCPGARVNVVPNIINTEAYTPADNGDGKTILYVGAMDWYPNRDAVEFFVSSILPLLRKKIPGVRFIVAGRNPPETFQRQFSGMPDVEFTGTVSDMRDQIAQATVCVVPLRIGSGTRLKILEAGAMGKATVSTHLGAEGLDLVDGEEIILEDEPQRFAGAVEECLLDSTRRRALGQAARQRVREQYSLPVLRKTLRNALNSIG